MNYILYTSLPSIMNAQLRDLIEEAKRDPSLFSSIDVDKLLDSLENVKNEYLDGQTMQSVTQDIFDSIHSLPIAKSLVHDFCNKLVGYRFVDEIYQLHRGKHVRWIRHTNPEKMMVGGIVVDVKFTDDGVNVLCRLHSGRFTQYRFDQCLTFQKLTDDEQLLLMIYEDPEFHT